MKIFDAVFSFSLAFAGFGLPFAAAQFEVATYDGKRGLLVDDSASADGEFGVVMTGDDENLIVNLRTQKPVLTLTAEDDRLFPYLAESDDESLLVKWSPDMEGYYFGLLLYGTESETVKAYLIDAAQESATQHDILPKLDAAAVAAERARGVDVDSDTVFRYTPKWIEHHEPQPRPSVPIEFRVKYAAADRSEMTGEMLVRATRTGDDPEVNVFAVEVEPSMGDDPEPEEEPTVEAGSTAEEFVALRDAIDVEVEGEDVRKVKVHADSDRPGRRLSYLGYVKAYVLEQLVYSDREDDENKSYVIYYWREGLLVSAYEVRMGRDTEMSEVGRTNEIYNFEDQKLVGWIRDGAEVPPDEPGFAEVGERVLDDSIARAGPIYLEIGAD